jgi:hypothetical protein
MYIYIYICIIDSLMHVHTGNLLVAAMCHMCHISVIANRPERLDRYRWSASTSRTCSDAMARSDPVFRNFLRPQQPQKSAYLSLHSRNPTLLRLRWDGETSGKKALNSCPLSWCAGMRWVPPFRDTSELGGTVQICFSAKLCSVKFELCRNPVARANGNGNGNDQYLSVFARTRLPPGWCETWE